MVDYAHETTLTDLWLADLFIVSVPTVPSDQGFLTLAIVELSLLLPYQDIHLLLSIKMLPWFSCLFSICVQFALEATHSICTLMSDTPRPMQLLIFSVLIAALQASICCCITTHLVIFIRALF
jgi:hypothetical protein